MVCPNCQNEDSTNPFRCAECGYGLAAKPKPPKTKPRYMGDKGVETRDEELARMFRCTNCRSHGGSVKRIATTGSGFSRMLDFQNNEFIVVSCSFCGLVQMYDPKVVDAVSVGWPIADLFTDLG